MNLLTSGSLFKRHPPQLCKTKNKKNNRFQKVFVQLLLRDGSNVKYLYYSSVDFFVFLCC